jgi:hypothetical protein
MNIHPSLASIFSAAPSFPYDMIQAPSPVNLSQNSSPTAMVHTVNYNGNGGTFYLIALVSLPSVDPGPSGLNQIKFGTPTSRAIQIPAGNGVVDLKDLVLATMARGAAYERGVADAAVIILDGPDTASGRGIYARIYIGQYNLT